MHKKKLLSLLLALSFLAALIPFGSLPTARAESADCVHEWDEGTVTLEATCTAAGSKLFTCSLCGTTKTEEVGALGHTFGSWQTLNKSWHRHFCIRCGVTHDGYHKWDAGTVSRVSTCATPGVKTFRCMVCDGTKTEAIDTDPNNHEWDNGTVTTEAACATAGTMTYTCVGCGVTKEESIAPAHTGIVTDAAVAPTCSATGLTAGSHCADCGTVITPQETVPANSHTAVVDGAVAPTCSEAGKTEGSHCSVCGAVLTPQETIPALGHTPVADAAAAATCLADGKTEGSHCSVCGQTLTAQETIPALGHSYGSWQQLDGDTHQRVCSRDASHTETAAHNWDDGAVKG
ncbi:MAG: hypothetical protein IJK98_07320, partial [Clostridia bacterium]|nr:hypothetical protein [Clostridia bacterium]